ncbi:MAG: rRNA maturation RNase YbeY [Bryobacteraceae bacterium]|jgi:probable rRNA maturation factor
MPATLDRSLLESFADTLRARVARGQLFHCRITNDKELHTLNLEFRKKDYATDVLSFPNEDASGYLGDIAISLQRARAQALEWGHPIEDEIRILMLHGVLHLRGMDHEGDSGAMARTELRWRRKLGLPAGLIERVAE